MYFNVDVQSRNRSLFGFNFAKIDDSDLHRWSSFYKLNILKENFSCNSIL